MSEIEQAAERLRRCYYGNPTDSPYSIHSEMEREDLVTVFKEEHAADDGKSITEAEARDMLGGTLQTRLTQKGLAVKLRGYCHIKTRGQLRQLLRALGSEVDGE